ncbi:MAG TPA: redoxin domain-containing protein [Terracidiphilus sp.]|jgi:peroxiredoxin|nr:redoxin domain-containing protein [Terracidiphilus sp.]
MNLKLSLASLPLLGLALLAPTTSVAQTPGGLQPGAQAPAFSLRDQAGKKQDLNSLAGPNGLLLLFFRSADWCPFCKGQLVDLEGSQKAFAAKGINVAAVSYDSTDILASFAHRRNITYPLLSDQGSKLIDKFGIRNPEGSGIEAGIPYPGYYLIDPQGKIKSRFFETAYVNRLTASNLYAYLFGNFALPVAEKQVSGTPHVTIATGQSDTSVTPGSLVRLLVNITPGPDTHVYGPGADKLDYHVTTLTIAPSDLYQATAVSYPTPKPLEFPELHQTVPVYTGPTVFSVNVAAVVNRNTIPIFAKEPNLPIKGEIAYQACTSTVCYPPAKAEVEWNLNLKQLDLVRAPDDIQHK